MKLIYLVINEILNPVVDSQIIFPASMMVPENEVVVVALVPIGQMIRPVLRDRLRAVRRRCHHKGLRCVFVAGMPSRIRIQAIERWLVQRAIVREIKGLEAVVHARCGHAASIVAGLKKRSGEEFRMIYDCRGDEPSEVVDKAGFEIDRPETWSVGLGREYDLAFSREKISAQESDAVISVSENMKSMIVQRHGIEPSKVTVIPCAVNMGRFSSSNRDAAREKLGVENDFIVAYLGSVEWYQRFDQAIRIFKILGSIKENAIFLVITSQEECARGILAKECVPESQVILLQLKPDEVPFYLGAADVGLLLRYQDKVNAVASPVKCAEYLASGVPVVLTEGIGDYSNQLSGAGVGWKIELEKAGAALSHQIWNVVDDVMKNQKEIRGKCSEYAQTYLSWKAAEENLKNLYIDEAFITE